MGSSKIVAELDRYDSVQISLTCLSGVDRKMVVPTKRLREVLLGSETVSFETTEVAADSFIFDVKSSAGRVRIDPNSFRNLPWLTRDGHRVGGARCEIAPPPGSELGVSPRTAAIRLAGRLREKFGLIIKSAVEAEFMIYQKDGTTPFNNITYDQYGRFDTLAGLEEPLLEMCQYLEEAGLPLETFMSEFASAQFEITFRPEEGVASADTIMLMKDGLRVSLGKYDMMPTFMACPNVHSHANGFHLNHSLWTADGVNQFIDLSDSAHVSSMARHWIAGLVHHAPALTALYCPTLNCYRRIADEFTPKTANWAEENRLTFLRLKTERNNVYLENRLPSSASNPYLVLAGTLAAGMDGLERKLPCPVQNDPAAPNIPRTLEEAISCLEKDHVLIKVLGEELIQGYLSIAKKTLNESKEKSLEDLDCQRSIYFHCI